MSTYSMQSTNWTSKVSAGSMRERNANEMLAQILKNADNEMMAIYNAQQAKLREDEDRLRRNLTFTHQVPASNLSYMTQPTSISTFPASSPSPFSSHLPLTSSSTTAAYPAAMPGASISAVALLQPALPMYPLANAGCLVYEQNHANGYHIMHSPQPQPQQQQQQALYVNNHNNHVNRVDTNPDNFNAVDISDYVDYSNQTAAGNPATSMATVSIQCGGRKNINNQDGNIKDGVAKMNTTGHVIVDGYGTAAMPSVTLMAAPAASASTLGTFVRSNESVQNMDSAVNSVVNSVNYSVADRDQEYEIEDCLNFFCGGFDIDEQI